MKTTCERDMPSLPNQVQPPLRHQQIFNEINLFVSYYKQYEFEIRKALDTPIKMMQIFRVAKQSDHTIYELQEVINKNILRADFQKLEIFEEQILGPNPIEATLEIKMGYPSLSNSFNIFQQLFNSEQDFKMFIDSPITFQELITALEILDQ